MNLQSFESAETLISQRNHWEDVIGMLRRSEMPPLEEEQPEEPRRQAVAAWLERELARIDRVTPPDPGRVTARRLNRNEYNNTIRDLLGVEMRPADDFPQDDAGYGFDNIADVLSLSPVLMEKYLSTADSVARVALFGQPTLKPTLTRLRSEGRRAGDARTFPLDYDVTGLSMPNAFHAVHRVPVEGEYMIKVFLGGVRPAHSDPISLSLWVDDREVRSPTALVLRDRAVRAREPAAAVIPVEEVPHRIRADHEVDVASGVQVSGVEAGRVLEVRRQQVRCERERAVALVPVDRVGDGPSPRGDPLRVIGEDDVEIAVAVEVGED